MKDTTSRILLAAIFVAVVLIGYAVWRETQRATQPIRDISAVGSGLATQVAEVIHPTPTIYPDPITVIREIKSLTRLETAQYAIEKVVTAETGQGAFPFLFGDKLLFVAHGTVIAGVDFAKMGLDDLRMDEQGRVYVILPEPEVFVATLDNEKSYVYDRQTGIFTRGNVDLETQARQVAEDEIRKAALEDGILDMAKTNARAYMERLLLSLRYTEVIFVEPTPGVPPTPSG